MGKEISDSASDLSDLELIQASRAGDYRAFETLLVRHEDRIYQSALRMIPSPADAEEVVQQTYLALMAHLDQFRREASFTTWLSRITTNQALQWLRKEAARPSVSLDNSQADQSDGERGDSSQIDPSAESPEDIASEHEERQILTDTLDELDPKYSLVVVLRDREGFSTNETAEVLGLTPENVKIRLARARKMLRKKFQQRFPAD